MPKYYKKINIDNLASIQEQVIKLITPNWPAKIYFPKHLKSQFLQINELTDNLIKLGYDINNTAFGVNLSNITPANGTPIHLDWGYHEYSLNIPIANCSNTYVNFYTSTTPAELASSMAGNYYYSIVKENCTLVDTIHMDDTYMINIKEPHNVVNTANNRRITLLIRNEDNQAAAKLFNS